jgi:Rieske Fe-S protein
MEDQESKTCEAKEGNGEAANPKEGDGAKSCQSGSACGGGGGCEAKGECSRSQFLRAAVPCVGGAWALMAAYPIYSYLTPNGGDEPESKVSSVTVGDLKDLPPGSGKNFKFGSVPALVTHTQDGQLHAFVATCTHLGCTAQYRPEKNLIWCACHGGCYDPSTGKNVAGPPPKPLTALKVEVVNDKIVVSKG